MKKIPLLLSTLLSLIFLQTSAQGVDTSDDNSGIWQYLGQGLSKDDHPEVEGRLSNFRWADLEPQPNVWDWHELDSELTAKAADSLPIIFMVYTKEDAPDWLWTNGVPKVIETDDAGNVTGYAPYYADPEYKSYFE